MAPASRTKSRRTAEESRTSIINADTSIIFQCWQKNGRPGCWSILVLTGQYWSIGVKAR